MKYLVVIVGPTAIGKTSVGIQLAKLFSSEIISADSRQFFKEMTIGTAVPSIEELAAAPHHFIQHKSIKENYSVGNFEKEGIEKINQLFKNHNVLFMVGGSGLYIDAITKGLNYFPAVNPEIRERLNRQYTEEGIEVLQQQLCHYDSKYAQNVDLNNPHRIIRALAVCMSSGKPYSSFLKEQPTKRDFTTIKIGLTAPRELIYQRIEQRVDFMIDTGLLDEAKKLYPFQKYNALNTVGYKELFTHFEGKSKLDFAIQEIKKNTRRFAKRQLTWFKKDNDIQWFEHNHPITEIKQYILKKTTLHGKE